MDLQRHATAPRRPAGLPLRVLFFSHDSQGLGHFRRNRALAHALARRLPVLTGRPVTGLLVNGVAGAGSSTLPPGFDVVTLPAIGKAGSHYGPRHLDLGMDTVVSVRGEIVRATGLAFRPDLVVVDRHALGVDGELLGALHAMRGELPGARFVLGLRDVLDDPAALASEWRRTPTDVVAEIYDEIWAYGDARVHDLRTSGELPAALTPLVRYQGFLAHGRAEEPVATALPTDDPFLLTTAGGGSDGVRLCGAAARAEVPRGHAHLVVTGPQMSDPDHRRIEREAGPRTTVVRSVPDAAGLIRRAAATVSMAGYNTVTETLATDVPALLVPREWPRTEQLLRASALQSVGVADLLRDQDLTPRAVSEWWSRVVRTRVDRSGLELTGLQTVARSAARLVASSDPSTRPPQATPGARIPLPPHRTVARGGLPVAV